MRMMLAQTAPVRFDIAANIVALEGLCRQATAAKAELLVLPELALSGYNVFERLGELAEPLDGPLCERVGELARKYRLHVIMGIAERDDSGRLYNSAVIFDDHGKRIAVYRKRQLWDREHQFFTPGEALCVADTRLGRIGLMICYDNEFPEIARALAQRGAELIVSPTANMQPNAQRQHLQIRVRAIDNQCFVACVNRAGREDELDYCGHSLVADPNGEVIGQLGEAPGTLVVELDFAAIARSRNAQDYLRDLRVSGREATS